MRIWLPMNSRDPPGITARFSCINFTERSECREEWNGNWSVG